ncbi:hypothetical protein ODS41_03100 [Pyrobaculum sp. 3827-6]|uniref:hypothetical protein n=1 Tax=Pyrobaculum sp. 3827-6 TaxID=2983604 RepID=UPI0021DA969B|nr:hypothetical protein [Pyrobaculum sp. 3827-6]MCU7786915.1 hypothetical protein [Pyrobaculum sp. 3827-6]
MSYGVETSPPPQSQGPRHGLRESEAFDVGKTNRQSSTARRSVFHPLTDKCAASRTETLTPEVAYVNSTSGNWGGQEEARQVVYKDADSYIQRGILELNKSQTPCTTSIGRPTEDVPAAVTKRRGSSSLSHVPGAKGAV